MLFEKRIISVTGKYDGQSPETTVTFHVLSDDWRDGPLEIAFQGTAKRMLDDDGKVEGWLARGKHWEFGHEIDKRIVATQVEVADRKVIDSDDEYQIFVRNGGIAFDRNAKRMAVVQWTVKQNFKKPSFENQEPDDEQGDEPSEDDLFTLDCSKEFYDAPFTRCERTGVEIVNSADDPFLPTPTKKKAIRAFVLTRKERKNNLKKYEKYENVVNKDRWHGAEPGTVLMESIIPKWDGSIFTVAYNFKYKQDGWGKKYLDTGLRVSVIRERRIALKDGGTRTEKVRVKLPIIPSDVGTQTEEPVKLDGGGYIPVRRKIKTAKSIQFTTLTPIYDPKTKELLRWEETDPVCDPDTGAAICWEEGDSELDDKDNEIPYKDFPGVDLPRDDYESEGLLKRVISKRNFFWKFKELPFADPENEEHHLHLPNPYTVEPREKPKPRTEDDA